MKNIKKLFVSSLIFTPLAFVPNCVRNVNKNNFSFRVEHFREDCQEYAKYIDTLIRDFDLVVDVNNLLFLPTILENKKADINKKIENLKKQKERYEDKYLSLYQEYLNGFLPNKKDFDINEYFTGLKVKEYRKGKQFIDIIYEDSHNYKPSPWKILTKKDFKKVPRVDYGKIVSSWTFCDNQNPNPHDYHDIFHLPEEERINYIIEWNNNYLINKIKKAEMNVKIANVAISFFNAKIKVLENLEKELLTTELKLDYKASMKKHYSSEALMFVIGELNNLEIQLKNAYSHLIDAIKRQDKSGIDFLQKEVERLEAELVDLSEIKKILEKHFSVK